MIRSFISDGGVRRLLSWIYLGALESMIWLIDFSLVIFWINHMRYGINGIGFRGEIMDFCFIYKKSIEFHLLRTNLSLLSQNFKILSCSFLVFVAMNPDEQEIKSLLMMLPKKWNVEDRVVGVDLGLDKFQFHFILITGCYL